MNLFSYVSKKMHLPDSAIARLAYTYLNNKEDVANFNSYNILVLRDSDLCIFSNTDELHTLQFTYINPTQLEFTIVA